MTGPAPHSWAIDPDAARAWELLPGLWRLRLPTPWHHVSHVNVYAIDRADGGVLLVDCGCGGHPTAWATLERGLALADRSVTDVRELVITHFHSDHIGVSGPLAAASGCVVSAHPDHRHFFDVVRAPARVRAEREALARAGGAPEQWLDDCATVAEEVDGTDDPVEPQRALTAGVTVASALGPWEVIETPGHAPSHICLLQRERGLLLVADLVSTAFTTFGDWGYSPDPIGEYLASVEAVGRLGVKLALPGHGRPIEDVDAVVSLYGAGIAERLDAVEAAARGGAATPWEIALAVFGSDGESASAVWAYFETLGYLRRLDVTGRLPAPAPAR